VNEVHWWNTVLTAALGLFMFLLKGRADEILRIDKLLQKTREQVARDTVTRGEVDDAFKSLQMRIDSVGNRLSDKIDQIRRDNHNDTKF
jgi:hypothetical protein